MYAAESCLFAIDDFSVAAFIDFASTVGANIKAWFNSDCYQLGKALE